MTISLVQPLAVGNALRVYLSPPAGAVSWVLLRNTTGTFSGYNDPSAVQVYSGNGATVLDYSGLTNGATYYYADFYWNGSSWSAGTVASGVPQTTYVDQSTDVLTLVRSRLDYGIQAEIAAGNLVSQSGVIQVLTAPPIFEDTRWPVVVVHVESDGSDQRGIGELMVPDLADPITATWMDTEGWHAQVQLSITGYSLNPDERIALRQALRRIILANLPVFDFAGMLEITFTQQDTEDFTSYASPIYFTAGSFACKAPASVADAVGSVTDVTVAAGSTI